MNSPEHRAALELVVRQLRQQRLSSGLSQEKLGNMLNIGQGGVSRIETMQNAPGMRLLIKVVEALGCEIRIVRKGAVDDRSPGGC